MSRPRRKDGAAPKSSKRGARPARSRAAAARKSRKHDTSDAGMPDPGTFESDVVNETADEGLLAFGLNPGESPDQMLQRECIRTLQEPGLKPHERLKVIQTLDKVNERLAREIPQDDCVDELRAWIRETLEGGPGPFSDA